MNNLLWPFNEKLRLQSDPVSSERHHAKKECKASSVLNKFKEMEERAANGEDEYSEWSKVPVMSQLPREGNNIANDVLFVENTFSI